MRRARAVVDRMPEELAGATARVLRTHHRRCVRPGQHWCDGLCNGPEGEMQDPVDILAVMLGMEVICQEDAFTGTAARTTPDETTTELTIMAIVEART